MRCYNGAPDSELQALIDNRAKLLADVRKFEPSAHVTFHAPHGNSAGGHIVHVWGRELSNYHPSVEGALLEMLNERKEAPTK